MTDFWLHAHWITSRGQQLYRTYSDLIFLSLLLECDSSCYAKKKCNSSLMKHEAPVTVKGFFLWVRVPAKRRGKGWRTESPEHSSVWSRGGLRGLNLLKALIFDVARVFGRHQAIAHTWRKWWLWVTTEITVNVILGYRVWRCSASKAWFIWLFNSKRLYLLVPLYVVKHESLREKEKICTHCGNDIMQLYHVHLIA